MIFGCRCVSMWIQMSCCSFLEGRAGLIEQQCNLFVVRKTSVFPLPLAAISCIGLDLVFFLFLFLLFSNEERVAGCLLVCYWHPLSPRRSVPSSAPWPLLSPRVSPAKATLSAAAAGRSAWAQLILRAALGSTLEFCSWLQLIRRC